jgi:hypothetical protein
MRAGALAVWVVVAAVGCGGAELGGDGGDDAGDADDLGDDAGDADGPDDGDDADDGGDGELPDGVFRLTGAVAPGLALRPVPGGETPRVVDHVVAVTPSSTTQRRAVATVGADGSFSLDIDAASPWVLVFVDSTRVGADMIAGVFGAGTLDALTPTATGAFDLGDVTVADGEAAAGVSYADLLTALGLDAAAAYYLGAIDDVCLRYVNPDIDGDGLLDALEDKDHHFLLDFHVQRAMLEDGVPVTIADLVGRFLDPDLTESAFGGTGVYVSVPSEIWSGPRDEAAMTFSADLHYQGDAGAETAVAGTPVTGADLIDNDFGDMRGVGVAAAPGFDMPQGTYQAALGTSTFTFTSVATLTDAELASAEGTLLPFARFAPLDPNCVEACQIAALDVEWRKRTSDGWILATEAELALTVGMDGGFVSLLVGSDTSIQSIGMQLPAVQPTASVAWDAANAFLFGIDAEAFAALTTDQLCHFGLSYDDRLGMRHFAGIANAPGTCE